MNRSRGRAVVDVLIAAACFGTTGTSQALAPAGATSLSVGSIRLIIGATGLFAVLPRSGGSVRESLRIWRLPLGALAGLCTALYQVFFFIGVARAGVALGALVTIGSGPILAGLLAWIFLGDRPTRIWMLATAVGVAGLALLSIDGASNPQVDLSGLVFALASSLAYASYTVIGKHLMNQGRHSGEVMAGTFGLGALILVPVFLLTPMGWLASWTGIGVALYLGLVATTFAYVMFGRGLSVLGAGPVATLVLGEPVVATILGVLFLGERLGMAGWVGWLLVLAGLALQGLASARGGIRRGDADRGTVEAL